MKFKKEDLINFEKEVVKRYKRGNTYAPVHLSGSVDGKQEEVILEIFKKIKKNDWVFCTHRSHYVALLKSQDKDWLINEIINKGQSSHINSGKYKIFSSAIVGGIIPISLGVALGIKLQKKKEKVYCFVGDMASRMGQFKEAVDYATAFCLPITFIIENNNMANNTPTNKVWNNIPNRYYKNKVMEYSYKRKFPHYGIGEWIEFKKRKVKGIGDYNAE